MKKQMKKVSIGLAVICIVLLGTGCASRESRELFGKVLKDAEGNLYMLEHRFGDLFFVDNIDVESINAFE